MSNFSAEAKVGLLVVVGIILLVFMSMKVGDLGFSRNDGYSLYVTFDSVTGLAEDTSVEIAGVEVGRVGKIELQNGKALVTLKIRPEIKLTEDVSAIIRTRGILGDKFVELIPGSSVAPALAEGGTINKTISTIDIDMMMSALGDVAKDIKTLTTSLSNVAGGQSGEDALRSIIENSREMLETLNKTVQENNEEVTRIIANFAEFSERLKDIGNANSDDIREIVANVRRASEKVEELMVGMGEITAKINNGEGSLGKLVNEDETAENLNAALASLRNVSEKIDNGEGTLGRLVNDEETVENLNETLESINDFLAQQERFKTYLDYKAEYLFDTSDVKSYVTLKIQPKEDKYYILQLVDDPRGKKTVTEYTRTDENGNTTFQRVEEVEKNKLKFTAEIAKRYHDLVLRGGIIESSGGFGLDYYLFEDYLKLSFDAFDFDPDTNAHLKLSADFSPIRHIYLTGGYDDFISDNDTESFFIGAGINFSDEDIKSLMSGIALPVQ